MLLFRGFEILEPLAFEEVALSLVSQPPFETWRRARPNPSVGQTPHLLVGSASRLTSVYSGSSLVNSTDVMGICGCWECWDLAPSGLKMSL